MALEKENAVPTEKVGETTQETTQETTEETTEGMLLEISDKTRVKTLGEIPESSEKGSEKGSEKSSEKILQLMSGNKRISAGEIAIEIGITPRAVEKQIASLKKRGKIRRIGPDKGGHWEVLD